MLWLSPSARAIDFSPFGFIAKADASGVDLKVRFAQDDRDTGKPPYPYPANPFTPPPYDSSGYSSTVIHKKFGRGVVVKMDINAKFIHVKFTLGEKKFIFPDAFLMGFLEVG